MYILTRSEKSGSSKRGYSALQTYLPRFKFIHNIPNIEMPQSVLSQSILLGNTPSNSHR